MLPTFVIGLREGLEASLIIGIIATFLGHQGRRDALRWMWAGVAGAVTLCAAVAIVLRITEENLPQRQQEGLETVVGLAAVGMVTWMIVWMRRHARGLKRDLEGKAAAALAGGSVRTLVLMAFLAVLREGFETAVFLLAAFQGSRDPAAAGTGATLGVVVAIVIGIGIYRGGVRLNLEKFFRFTGFVLVLVAAGLVATAAHTAHEAGWLNIGQHEVLNLTGFVGPGSVRSALLTGMLGVQVRPVVAEAVPYLLYLVPLALFVLWPARRRGTGGIGDTRGVPVEKHAPARHPVTARTKVGATALVAATALLASGCGSSASTTEWWRTGQGRAGRAGEDRLQPGGAHVAAHMRDPRNQFVPIQNRLAANDALNEYIEHTSSAIFAVPPGVERGGYIGGTLFAS